MLYADDRYSLLIIFQAIVTSTLRNLDLKFPKVTEAQIKLLAEARKTLEDE